MVRWSVPVPSKPAGLIHAASVIAVVGLRLLALPVLTNAVDPSKPMAFWIFPVPYVNVLNAVPWLFCPD